jgi:hypothetical protein
LLSSPTWGSRPDIFYCLTVTVLFLWGALSNERTGLSFVHVYAAGPDQSSLSRVRVPWYSKPYFSVSDLRLPFPSPPTIRRVKSSQVKVTLRLTVSQSVSLGAEPHLGLMTRYLLLFDSYGPIFVGRPLWREDGSVFCICCWALPAQSCSGPRPLGLATIFFCLRFETSLFVASYDLQGYGGDIRPRLYTGMYGSSLSPLSQGHGGGLHYIRSARTTEKTSHMIPTQRVNWINDCCLATSYNIRPLRHILHCCTLERVYREVTRNALSKSVTILQHVDALPSNDSVNNAHC